MSGLPAGALMDVNVRVWAEIGRTRMPLADAMALAEGWVVDLDREHHEPIDLYVNGHRYARGHLVMVEGEWALTIDEVLATGAAVERLSKRA
jgi:flagellar motor switch protein FliN